MTDGTMIQPDDDGRKAWLEMIAAKAGSDVDHVKDVLARNGISARQTKAVPQRLTITSIQFSGLKGNSSVPFDFKWDALGPGVWAVLSEHNLRGKTTVLNVIRWTLTGKRSIRDDMDPWFRNVSVGLTLDGRDFRVVVTDAQKDAGQLERITDGKVLVVRKFWDDESFEATMSDFFMGELGLQPILNHTERDGKSLETPHGWNWLFTSMLIEPNPAATFGSQAIAGMPIRMMQMFMGLPWANTTNDIKAAQGRHATKASQANTLSTGIRSRTQQRIDELKSKRDDLSKTPVKDSTATRKKLAASSDEFSKADGRLRMLVNSAKLIEDDVAAARTAYDESRRSLLELKDSVAAGYIFRTLKPVCCPSCDETFTSQRERERQEAHVCLVCGTAELEPEDSSEALERSEAAVKEAAAELARQEKRAAAADDQVKRTTADREAASKACETFEKELADADMTEDPRVALLLIGAQLTELEALATAATEDAGDEVKIIDAAEDVTKSIYKAEQDRILRRVSDLTTEYAQKFGMVSLESVNLNGAGQMRLVKLGTDTSFRHQTDGEKARLKVAATLAMLKISEEEGVGRHPGLLLIDSPKSNEMIDKDYAMLIEGLMGLTDELKTVQVIFTGIAQPVVLRLIPQDHRLHAKGEDYLW